MTNIIDNACFPHETPSQFHARLSPACPRGDSGQSLVELALTLPLFLLILLGTAEFARFAWASIETTNAARAGVQYGAQTHVTAADIAGMQAAALNDGVNLTGLTATPTSTCACSTAATTTLVCKTAISSGSCASPAVLLVYVQVTTSSTVKPLYHWPGLPTTFTANGSAVMEVEQ